MKFLEQLGLAFGFLIGALIVLHIAPDQYAAYLCYLVIALNVALIAFLLVLEFVLFYKRVRRG